MAILPRGSLTKRMNGISRNFRLWKSNTASWQGRPVETDTEMYFQDFNLHEGWQCQNIQYDNFFLLLPVKLDDKWIITRHSPTRSRISAPLVHAYTLKHTGLIASTPYRFAVLARFLDLAISRAKYEEIKRKTNTFNLVKPFSCQNVVNQLTLNLTSCNFPRGDNSCYRCAAGLDIRLISLIPWYTGQRFSANSYTLAISR